MPYPPRARPSRGSLLTAGSAFWVQASVLLVLMAASSVPSPLYPVYQAMWGFPPVVLTLIFAAYVLALLAALLVVGSLSDHVGRRPVLLAALTVEIAAMLVFLGAGDAWALITARLLQGAATGAAMGALGAYLIDLEPAGTRGLGTVVNGAAPPLGLALGAVASSLLVAAAPRSMQLVYIVLAVLLVLQLIATALGPETRGREPGAAASLIPRVHFPRDARRLAVWVLPGAVATWSLGGLVLSLGPSLVLSLAGRQAGILTGLIVAALTGTGGIATLLFGRVRRTVVLAAGMAALALGLGGAITALLLGSVGLYFAAIVLAGGGFGLGFLGVLGILLPKATSHERAGLLSAIYVVSYLANSVPAVVSGAVVGQVGLVPTAIGYTAAVIALALFVLAGLAIQRSGAAPATGLQPAPGVRATTPSTAAVSADAGESE